MKDSITVNLCTDHALEFATDIIGREGEGDATQFVLYIPKELSDYSIYFDVEKPSGEKFRSPRLNIENGVALYNIPRYLLTEAGEIKVQAIAQNDSGEVWKSDVKKCVNLISINALDKLPESQKEDFMFVAQKVLNALGQEVEEVAEAVADDPEFGEDVAAIIQPYIEARYAKLSDDIAKKLQLKPNFANDISGCTDTSALYVLPDGNIYAYMFSTVETVGSNKFVPQTATLNQRLSGSAGSVSANNSSIGSFVTDFIAIKDLEIESSYIVRLNWEILSSDENKIVFYDSSKTRIGNNVFGESYMNTSWTVADGETTLDIKKMLPTATVTPAWENVSFIRLQLFVKEKGTALVAGDVSNLKITFDAENATITTYQWTKTGRTFIPADYEDRIIELESENKEQAEKISILERYIADGDGVIGVPSFWEDAVNECIAKIKNLQVGRNCVTFPFFSDNHQRNGYAGVLIAKVMKECHIPYCFFGGDSISSGYIADEATMIAQDKAFDTAISCIPNGRFCRAVGNHDGYWAVDTNNKNYYTDAQNYELFLREESIAQNKHFGGDGTYYYVDDIASKMRWVVLDTNDNAVEAEQITWLQNTALSFNENGWAVVFISHQPISNHYHALISNAADVRDVVKNYINGTHDKKADIVGWFSGHIHRDRIYTGEAVNTTDDSVGEDMQFKQVTITSDNTGISYDDATKHSVANDDKSHAIDFVTINKVTRTVNLTRLGIGSDRSYTY